MMQIFRLLRINRDSHPMKKAFFLFLMLFSSSVFAADRYVLDGGTSSACLSWSDACDQLSTAENLIARGETIWVGDGDYTAPTISVPVSGTTYIYIKKATASAHGTETGWNSTYGDGVANFTGRWVFSAGTGYLDIDGVVGSGMSGHGFYMTPSSCAASMQLFYFVEPMNGLRFRHLEAEHCGYSWDYNHDIFYFNDTFDDVLIEYCWLHNVARTCILTAGGGTTNLTVQYTWMTEVYGYDGYGIHGEAMSINNSGTAANHVYRYNVFRNIEGTGIIVIKDSTQAGFKIYGNIFYADADHILDGFVAGPEPSLSDFSSTNSTISEANGVGEATYNVDCYNNTFVDLQGEAGFQFDQATSNDAINNLFVNCGTPEFVGVTTNTTNTTNGATSLFVDYANHDYRLSSALAGTSLESEYNKDMLDTTRGADGTWDRGAYEYDAGSTPPSATGCTTSGSVR
jgi:hypothetical protein